jgi:hypothetical protein
VYQVASRWFYIERVGSSLSKARWHIGAPQREMNCLVRSGLPVGEGLESPSLACWEAVLQQQDQLSWEVHEAISGHNSVSDCGL